MGSQDPGIVSPSHNQILQLSSDKSMDVSRLLKSSLIVNSGQVRSLKKLLSSGQVRSFVKYRNQVFLRSFSGPFQVTPGHFQVFFASFQVFSDHSGYLGIQVCDKPSSVLFPINVHDLPERVI